MIQSFKKIAKNNKTIVSVYFLIKSITLRDCFNLEKLNLFRKISPFTKVGYTGFSNAYELSKTIEKNGIEGAFVECGVWKGGCAATLAYVAKKAKSNRKTWLFDSFEGLPEPSEKDGNEAKEYAKNRIFGKLETINRCVASLEDVEEILFSKLNVDRKNIVIVKGWLQDTLPNAKNEIGSIAILRLDVDWYESTKCCLDNLYDNVISGGYVIFDDYDFWEGCKKAVDEFFAKRNIDIKTNKTNNGVRFFKKQDYHEK